MKIAAVVLAALSLGLAACGGDDDDTTATAPAPVATDPTTTEPGLAPEGADALRNASPDEVAQLCETGAPKPLCECLADELTKKGRLDEFVDYAIEAQNNPDVAPPDAVIEAAVGCGGNAG